MNTKINTKVGYVRTDGWRGYSRPIYAVAGANDTGMFPDSPCRTDVCKKELNDFCKILKKINIKYKRKVCTTSNIFCVHEYVIVSEFDHAEAFELAKNFLKETRLFYTCEILK